MNLTFCIYVRCFELAQTRCHLQVQLKQIKPNDICVHKKKLYFTENISRFSIIEKEIKLLLLSVSQPTFSIVKKS